MTTPSSALPTLADWTLDPAVRHLNHGSFGAVPRVALAVQEELRREMDADPDRWFRALPTRIAAARGEIAAQLGVAAGDLALVANASAGVSTVINSPGVLPAGGEVLLTDHAYGAVAMGVERAAARAGAKTATVHVPLEATADEVVAIFAEAIGAATALVVVDQITSATARHYPVGEIVRLAHAAGARVLVDGAHAPGQLADPVNDAGADYWVGNLHKWPCAPRGTAALVARGEAAQDLVPLIDSWGAMEPFPARFDHQGTLDVTGWLAAPRSWRFVEESAGWAATRARMDELVTAGQRVLAEALGTELDGLLACEAPSMRLVALPAGLAADPAGAGELSAAITAELGALVAVTSWDGRGFVRLSAHLYNTPEDYGWLAERLPAVLAAAARG